MPLPLLAIMTTTIPELEHCSFLKFVSFLPLSPVTVYSSHRSQEWSLTKISQVTLLPSLKSPIDFLLFRLKSRLLIFIFKILQELTHTFLSDLIPNQCPFHIVCFRHAGLLLFQKHVEFFPIAGLYISGLLCLERSFRSSGPNLSFLFAFCFLSPLKLDRNIWYALVYLTGDIAPVPGRVLGRSRQTFFNGKKERPQG